MAAEIKYVRWTAEDLPEGLTINEDTGVISGTPTAPLGQYSVYVTVETNYGSDAKYITILVNAPEAWIPEITPDQIINVELDVEMTGYEVQGKNVKKTV